MSTLRFESRREPSRLMLWLTPVLAVALTLIVGAVVFTALGYDGFGAVREIFVSPLFDSYRWQDLLVKAAPLALIAVGLSIGFRANVWNIGAEGQYVLGGLGGTGLALLTLDAEGVWILPAMIVCGILGGMVWAAVPALLRTRLGVSEILSSLMLNYVAIQLLYYLMRGPWKDPMGFNFPQTAMFSASQTLPTAVPGTLIHIGIPIALALAFVAWGLLARTLAGFQVRVVGLSPQAARFAGFREGRVVWMALLFGGGMAGLAGVLEAAGPFGQMVPAFPTGYGYTAIIVAFLGRLHPLGIVAAALVLALTYVGGESAQTSIGLPAAAIGVFQAMMLFFLLGVDILVRYRLTRGARPVAQVAVPLPTPEPIRTREAAL
ncbi:ABC transporter permease [Aureimonas jatrophae]|uniref:Nucleoside ABC transporter membrane protein n=1 Tax=Aureimonas jatrophae TaxID=1166073 RepID=A0A1H0HMK5_9HYPH|nr:ABC transporter permease [Aureimonas jatrophae]MBB3950673.1 simple sugar transport system permease protein [Aureimonas jatrophae]SDO20429.1 nucleoside ABC transporter membrane protein [Aureimonas jatrophae]